ncbi:MAG: amino acid permease [Bacteroidales bacterium]|nr:amino acid permease [Bacteroidales bacterium]
MSKLFRKKPIENNLNQENTQTGLRKNLTVYDLTALGIAAIVGAGIFSTIGTAAAAGGPAISLLFVFTAIACGFSAVCYAEFASRVPVSGSAYTYSYITFGELIAWIIGWDLIMEYSVGNIAVAISWSDYFTELMKGLGLAIPEYLSMDYFSAARYHKEALLQLNNGISLAQLSSFHKEAYLAFNNAPHFINFRLICDLPAFCITAIITSLIYIGIRESKIAGNIMVLIKLMILLVVISVGTFYVNTDNWHPFAPNGLAGVLKGVSGVFFAYIGFDAISTTAEECKNPRRDLPKAIIYALIICTVLYIIISLILTGMVKYDQLAVGDPLAYIFTRYNLHFLSGIIAFSAIIAMASVLLVFQLGQPRIWMSMSRDGLLPKAFSHLNMKFKTPDFSTVITGIIVAVPSLFLNLKEVTDLTSIGTLFAFVLVCGGILVLNQRPDKNPAHFKVYYINSSYYILPVWAIVLSLLLYLNAEGVKQFFQFQDINSFAAFWQTFKHKIPLLVYLVFAVILSYKCFTKKYSLIPVLGLLTNLYLMTELGITNWLRFILWLLAGLFIYFFYGINKSKLNKTKPVNS